MDSDEMDRDKHADIVHAHAVQLMEHFDSVQIICTKVEADGTVSYHSGRGNYYARFGSVREWVLKEEAVMRKEAVTNEE